jgi:hypothetical protein
MKYQWTDWITHVPGQQLPIGTYGIWEQVGRSGIPFQTEAMITAEQKNHPTWSMTDRYGIALQLLRYKLRSIADENEVVSERELDFVE